MDDLGDVELNTMLWNKRHMVISSNPALIPMMDVDHGKRLQLSSHLFYNRYTISNLERLGISPSNKKRRPLLRYSSQIPISVRVDQKQMDEIQQQDQAVAKFISLLNSAVQQILHWNKAEIQEFSKSVQEYSENLKLAVPFNSSFTFILKVRPFCPFLCFSPCINSLHIFLLMIL